MTPYQVRYSARARKELRKLDRFESRLILTWVETHLIGTLDPYQHGKGLVGDRSGEWRYRVGNYRLICLIENQTVTIHVLEVGHRKDIYR